MIPRRWTVVDNLTGGVQGAKDVVEDYRVKSALRLRFTADGPRGSMHWTVLEFYSSSGVVTVAHVGIPEDSGEGIAGLEVLARSFRFE
jgi:hypothetical protein